MAWPGSDLVGRVLGDRYRLVALVGVGASAQVYLADDISLRRRVAIKILHEALADDATFLRRFRAEAQAAAQLHHPGILVVRRDNDTSRDLKPAGIVRAIRNLEAAGVPIADQYIILNHWR